jgi:hypothetical protein
MAGDLFNYLGIHNGRTKHDQIGYKFGNLNIFINYRKSFLLFAGNPAQFQFHHQSVLINFLMKTMADFIQHIKRTTQDLVRHLFQQQLSVFGMMQIQY